MVGSHPRQYFAVITFLALIVGLMPCSAQTPSSSVSVNGTDFNYVIEGEGIPTLVLGSSIYYPRTFPSELREALQMHFVDLHWFAPDYDPSRLDELTIETVVDDIEAIRKALGLAKPLIIGHSIHGTIAMEYTKRYHQQIKGVVVVGSPAQWSNEEYTRKAADLWESASDERKALQQENWGELTEIDRLTGQEEAAARYNNMSPQYWYNPSYDAGWLWEGMKVHTAVTQHLFTKVFEDYDMFDFAGKLDLPILVVLGRYDYVIPYTLWDLSYDQLSDFTLKLFEKSGHTPQLEEPELFNQTLGQWLEEKIQSR